jgi:hypothetical protein
LVSYFLLLDILEGFKQMNPGSVQNGCSSVIPAVNATLLQLFSPSNVTQLTQAEHHFRACIRMRCLFLNTIKYLHSASLQPLSIILALRRSAVQTVKEEGSMSPFVSTAK